MHRVLVVDDHAANCVPLVKLFKFSGIEARCAFSGAEALAALAADPPEAILLDVMMPEMDGFEVLRAIRADARNDPVAVVMYSAVTDRESQARAMRMGALAYVVKGTSFDELRTAIRRHLPAEQRNSQPS